MTCSLREQHAPFTTPGIALVVVKNRMILCVVGTFIGCSGIGMCLQIARFFQTFFGLLLALYAALTLLSRERLWAPALALSILLDFQCASWSSLDLCLCLLESWEEAKGDCSQKAGGIALFSPGLLHVEALAVWTQAALCPFILWFQNSSSMIHLLVHRHCHMDPQGSLCTACGTRADLVRMDLVLRTW